MNTKIHEIFVNGGNQRFVSADDFAALEASMCVLMEERDIEIRRARTAEYKLREMERECEEQARLNGMGASRESALLARIVALEAEVVRVREAGAKEFSKRCKVEDVIATKP